MRSALLCCLLLAAGCQSGPTTTPPVAPAWPAPTVQVALPPGSELAAELAPEVPDEPVWRAALVLWREALALSPVLTVQELERPPGAAYRVRLAIDPAAKAVAATWLPPHGEATLLAGGSFADGDLPACLDRLAKTVRAACGDPPGPSRPLAAVTSGDVGAVLAVHDGRVLLRDGAVEAAHRAFTNARRRDGGACFVLEALAAAELLRGRFPEAERLCREALGRPERLSPPLEHRLARTLLFARASADPDHAPERDQELLALGQAGERERPGDPQCALTTAVALVFRSEFAAARPRLEALLPRLPGHALVAYHLGFACLGSGDAAAAVGHFAEAARRLPLPAVIVPLSIARFAAGDHDALAGSLAEAVAEHQGRPGDSVHALRRMQAAHALLRGDDATAITLLATDLRWLAEHPSVLANRAGEFADSGEVLVRLGHGRQLEPVLGAIQEQLPGTAVADAVAFLAGLVDVDRTGQRATVLESRLDRGGESVFGLRLAAFAHERAGEIADQHAALARAARLSDTPLLKAQLAQSLRAMGKVVEAEALQTALRRELGTVQLRARQQHPLLGPELAFAWRWR